MNHSDVRNHLADYLEGDLELGKRALVDAHLDVCEECSTDLAEIQSTIALLRSLEEPVVPHDLANQVMRRIRLGEGHQTWLDQLRATLSAIGSPAILYPASVTMILAGVYLAVGDLRVTIPFNSIAPQGQQIVRVGPISEPDGSDMRLAQSPLLAGRDRAVGSSAAPGHTPQPGASFVAATPPLRSASPQSSAGRSRPAAREHFEVDTLGRARHALAGAGVHRQAPRPPWAAVSSEAAQPRLRQVVSRPTNVGSLGQESFYPAASVDTRSEAGEGVIASNRAPQRSEWLDLVQRNPVGFAHRIATLTLAEQELWVDNLAKHAAEQGTLESVVAALRGSLDPEARLLADDFAAAGERLGGPVAGRVGDSSGSP